MSETTNNASLPGIGKLFIRYALAFMVTVGVGLAPLLGKLNVPLFTPIISLFPANLQESLVRFTAFLMGLPVLAAFYFEKQRRTNLRMQKRVFTILLIALVPLTLLLYSFYEVFVARVPIRGGDVTVAYVVGDTMLPDCPCTKAHLQIDSCIGTEMSIDPVNVTNCYAREEIRIRRLVVSLLYFLVMLSYATVIGLLVMNKWRPPRATRSRRTSEAAPAPPVP